MMPLLTMAQLTEQFDDGNFTISPQWQGNSEKFEITTSCLLHLNAKAETADAWLFTPSTVSRNATWKADIRFDFNPSSQNFAKLYLMADSNDPATIKNGYFVMIGSTNDDVSLWKITDSQTVCLIDGENARLSADAINLSMEVGFNENGLWTLRTKTGDVWTDEGTATDSSTPQSAWFGVYCKYTSTRSNKFYFDNIQIQGQSFQDKTPPAIESIYVTTGYNINVDFSENIDSTSFKPASFQLNNYQIAKITQRNPSSYTLTLNHRLSDDFNDILTISDIQDNAGNRMTDTTLQINYHRARLTQCNVISSQEIEVLFSKPMTTQTNINQYIIINPGNLNPQNCSWKNDTTLMLNFAFKFINKSTYRIDIQHLIDFQNDTIKPINQPITLFEPERHDIVFSEIMFDPEPANQLPESEYLEIKNRTNFDINLAGYVLWHKGLRYIIENGQLPANGFSLLVNPRAQSEWTDYGNVATLHSFPTLSNEGGDLALLSPQDKVLTSLSYSSSWQKGNFKDDGGWSFEVIDENNLSGDAKNWSYSTNLKGGTPGEVNSVTASNFDMQRPHIQYIEMTDSTAIQLHFSESISQFSNKLTITGYSENLSFNAISCDTIFYKSIILKSAEPLTAQKKYHLQIEQPLTDESNLQLTEYYPLEFGLSQKPEAGDVVINELLFNPLPTGLDYIEIYNRSDKTILLSDLRLAQVINQQIVSLIPLTSNKIPLLKGQYWVFSSDTALLNSLYQVPSPWYSLQLASMPSMPDDAGSIAITNAQGERIDMLSYSNKWQYKLLTDNEGVALERISVDAPTQSASNWQSAASHKGYGTPTQANSQSKDNQTDTNETIAISPQLITPDGDGVDDFVQININSANIKSVTLNIYNTSGEIVSQLAQNEVIGTNTFYKWDGSGDNGNRIYPGIYVIWCRTISVDGKIEIHKKAVVIGTKAP
jgi:hypothetical protein